MSFKLCVIGCGGFADYVHGSAQRAYAESNPEVTLAACCDLDAQRAQDYAAKFGFRRHYTNAEAMLEAEKPDGVCVLVAPQVSAAVAAKVLARGIPLLLEKPPGRTEAELDRLIELATVHGAPTQVGFNRRYMPLMRKTREFLASELAPIQQVTYEMIRYGRDDADFSVTAIHAVDAAQFLAGSPYRWAKLRFESVAGIPESRSNVTLLAECESGVPVNIHIQPMAGYVSESFAIHGVGTSVTGAFFGPGERADSGTITLWQNNEQRETFSDAGLTLSQRTGINAEVAAFCNAIRTGRWPTPSLAECRRQVRLMEAIRNGEDRIIEFPLEPELAPALSTSSALL